MIKKDLWLAPMAENEFEKFFREKNEPSIHFLKGLMESWIGYTTDGDSALSHSRHKTAGKFLQHFIREIRQHYNRQTWANVEHRITALLAQKLAYAAIVKIRETAPQA